MEHYNKIVMTLLFLGLTLIVFSNHFYQYNTMYNWMKDNNYSVDDFNIEGVYFENKVNDNGYFKRITIYATNIENSTEEHLFVYSYSVNEKVIFHKDNITDENQMYKHYKMAVHQDNEINPLLNSPFWIVIGYLCFIGFTSSLGYLIFSVEKSRKAKSNCRQ